MNKSAAETQPEITAETQPEISEESKPKISASKPSTAVHKIIAKYLNEQAASQIVKDAKGNISAMRKRAKHILSKQGRIVEAEAVDKALAAIAG